MIKENIEQWKPVKDYEELYAVSSMGRVKSVERTCKHWRGGVRCIKEKILKPALGGKEGDHYLIVCLSKNGVTKSFGVHVLVALAFPEICGLPFEGAQCNHIDENHFNNDPHNLEWLSHPDNNNYGTRNERVAKALSKTVYQYTTANELVKEWASTMEVERQTGFFHTAISACCRGEQKTAYNYVWSYTRL